MTSGYSKRKTPYSKMPLPRLKKIESDILNKNPDLWERLGLYYKKEKELMKLRDECQQIRSEIADIKSVALHRKQEEYKAAGSLKKFFMDRKIPKLTESEKAKIERLQKLLNKFGIGFDLNKHRDAYETKERLKRIKKYISQKEKKEIKKSKERAFIAAYKGKSRDLASRIKSDLKQQISIDSHCPYCGGHMGDDPHCDHIYPISKGGLSTPQNMVYICSDCNYKKNTLTLTQFIKKYGLQNMEIERRLEKLGKDF